MFFVEKPFCLTEEQGVDLISTTSERNLVKQIGYQNKFSENFREIGEVVKEGCSDEISNFTGETYGPVITKKKVGPWRSKYTFTGYRLQE